MSRLELVSLLDLQLAPELPKQWQELVGTTVRWYEDVYDDNGARREAEEPTVALVTGARWGRDADGRVMFGWLQLLLDRMDGTQRWTPPLQVLLS